MRIQNLSIKNLHIINILIFLTCLNIYGNAQTDREFWYVIPNVTPNHNPTGGQPNYLVFTTTDLPATVTVEMPADTSWTNIVVDVPANSTSRYILSSAQWADTRNYWDNMVGSPPLPGKNTRGLHITSTSLITVYHEYSNVNNPDIFALKGKNALGTEFYTTFQTRMYNVNNRYNNATGWPEPAYSAFDIVCTEDQTYITLEIPANRALYMGPLLPYLTDTTVTFGPFMEGETFSGVPAQVHAPDVNPSYPAWKTSDNYPDGFGRAGIDHLSGIRVTSNKDIAITLKDDSMKARNGGCYDLGGDQTIPVRLTGTEYIAMRGELDYTATPGDWYAPPIKNPDTSELLYIVATDDNTDIYVNSIYKATIDAGEEYIYKIPETEDITLVESEDSSVYVLQMSGFGCEIGEAVLPTTSVCTGSAQVGFTRSTDEALFLNVMVRRNAVNNFLLNGAYWAELAGSKFDSINPNWAAARIGPIGTGDIPVGTQSMISNTEDVFHLGIINGSGGGGTRFGYFSDYNVLEVQSLIVASGSDFKRMCAGDTVQIIASGGFFYKWTPPDYLSDDSIPTPVAYPPTDMVYIAHAKGACGTKDSTYVTVSVSTPCEANFAILDTAIICSPDSIKIHDMSFGAETYKWIWGPPGDITGWIIPYDTARTDSIFYHTYDNLTDTIQTWEIILSIQNPDLCRDSAFGYVTVLPHVVADFRVTDSMGCHPFEAEFVNESVNADHFRWDYGDNTSSFDSTVTHTHDYWNFTGHTKRFRPRLAASAFHKGYGLFCRDTAYFDSIVVFPNVEVGFTSDPAEGCAPFNVTFQNASIDVDTFFWYFDYANDTIVDSVFTTTAGFDRPFTNSTLLTQNPVIRLEGWNNDGGRECMKSWTDNLIVYPEVHAGFTPDTTTVCDDDSISIGFTNNSTGISLTYLWDFGDSPGWDDNSFEPSHTYENKTSGSVIYTVILEATAQANLYCKDIAIDDITVYPYIKARIATSKEVLSCWDFTDTIYNLTNRGTTYTWTSPDDLTFNYTKINKDPFTHQFLNPLATPQTYTLILEAENAEGCIDIDSTHSILVYPRVLSQFNSSVDVGCNPLTVTFENQSQPFPNIVSHVWHFGDGDVLPTDEQFVTHTFENLTSSDAVYTVTLTVENDQDCRHTSDTTITVYAYLDASFYFNDTNKCHPRALNLISDSKGGYIPNGHNWYFGDGQEQLNHGSTVTHTFTNQTNNNIIRDVILEISNTGGCTDSDTVPVVIYPEVVANFNPSPVQGCYPLTVDFTNTSNPVAKHFYWEFGDNTYDSVKSPVPHSYDEITSYNDTTIYVNLHALADNLVCDDDTTIPITIYAYIHPSIKINDPSVCHNVPLEIYNQSYGGIEDNTWDFQVGSDTTIDDPFFTYTYQNTTENVIYRTITLTVSNSRGCEEYATHDVTIYPQIRAAFDSVASACHPHNVTIQNRTNNLDGNNLYEWEFGDGGTSSDEIPSHPYVNYGDTDTNFIITLYATSFYDCKDSASQTISVYHVPLAKFNVNNNLDCHPFPVTFTNQSQPSSSTFYWDFENDNNTDTITTHTSQQVSHTYENTGDAVRPYTIELVAVSNRGCIDRDTLTIQVYPQVIALFSYNDSTGCSPFTYRPINHSTNAERFYWTYESNQATYTSSVSDPVQILTNTSNRDELFIVILKSSSEAGCFDRDTHYVTVFPQPITDFTYSSLHNMWYPGITLEFYNQSKHITNYGTDHPVDYTWNFGDGTGNETSPNESITHPYTYWSPNSSRTYTTTLIGTNTQHPQCADTTAKDIYMHPPKPEVYTSVNTSEICVPDLIIFTIDPEYTNPDIPEPFIWNFDDGTIYDTNATTVSHRFTTAKMHRVQITIIGYDEQSTTVTKDIYAHPKPVAEFDAVPRTVKLPDATIRCFNYSSEDAIYYEWDFGDGDTSTLYEPIHNYDKSGVDVREIDTFTIELIVITEFGCRDTIDTVRVAVIGQGKLTYPNAFNPNSENDINRTFRPYMGEEGEGVAEYEIWIYNRWGEMVFHYEGSPLVKEAWWDGTFMNTGKECKMDVYVYKVRAKFHSGQSYFDVGDVTLVR